jgi:hypothetical protein
VVAGAVFFFYEQSITERPVLRGRLANMLGDVFGMPELKKTIRSDPDSVRHLVWSRILLTYFRYPQSVAMVLVVGLIAPRLISYDLRSRAHLLYFSRPLRIWEYVLGKSMIVWFYMAVITTIPALCLCVIGVLMSTSWDVVADTWDLPLRILAASAVLILPTSALALAFSSLTHESRYATLAWISTWVIGGVSYLTLTASAISRDRPMSVVAQDWIGVSPYHCLGLLQQSVFGLAPETVWTTPYWVGAVLATLAGWFTIYHRVSKALRA